MESLAAPLPSALAGLKPDEQSALTKEYLTKKLPGWDKLKPDEQTSLVREVVGKYGTHVEGSVMGGPESTGEKLKSLGKKALVTGSGTLAAMAGPKVGAVAGGVLAAPLGPEAVPAGVMIGRELGAAVGGGMVPVAEAGAAKALGENVELPSAGEIISSAGINLGFHVLGETTAARAKKLRAAGALDLPIEQLNPVQVKQLVKNRDFWRSLGLPEAEIDSVTARPGAAALLEKQVAAGKQAKQAFQTVTDETRKSFTGQYAGLLGPHAETKTEIQDIGKTMQLWAKGQGQHELTPSFAGFLKRKSDEIASSVGADDPLAKFFSSEEIASMTPKQRQGYLSAIAPSSGKAPVKVTVSDSGAPKSTIASRNKAAEPVVGVPTTKQWNIQDIRDARTELRENLPAGATPLDRKAHAQLDRMLVERQDAMLTQSGATPEQVTAVHALDEKWGQFQNTLKELRPDKKSFGADVSKALWSDSAKSPTMALNLIDMAQAAEKARPGEVMEPLRESFMQDLMAQARKGQVEGGPVNEMKVLRKFQDQWRGTQEGQAVLDSMFGKDSPLADPTQISNALGRLNDPNARNKFVKMMENAGPNSWLVRGAALAAFAGGSINSIRNHPENAVPVAATLLSLAVAGPLLARMTPTAQRAYVKFIMAPNPHTLKLLTSVAGASTIGLVTQPSPKDAIAPGVGHLVGHAVENVILR